MKRRNQYGRFGYCSHCEENVQSVVAEEGFGYEYGSISGFHSVPVDVCPTCGEDVTDERIEEETEED